jgi:hypothetical protein
MDKNFKRLIKVNIQGRVFVACQSRGVTDPTIIGYYVEIMEQAITALLAEDSTPGDFQVILDDQLRWLEDELDQTRSEQPSPSPATKKKPTSSSLTNEEKKATGYMPEGKTMPERLKDRRAIVEHLLDNDCITLKLVTPDEAMKYKHGLLGKDPEKAEGEVVTALRNVLYTQMRKFIREHNGGPWASASQQHELRMDITKTRTLRSLVTLARELLSERMEWLQTKGSLTGRFFGGRVKMDK